MGLPWLIGAVYWKVNFDLDYEQQAGTLAFSVMVFLVCCILCFAVLGARRAMVKGELGGPEPTRTCSALICLSLWFVYIIVSIIQIYGGIVVPENDFFGKPFYSCRYPYDYDNVDLGSCGMA